MDSAMDLLDPSQALDLNRIRGQLIRLEDTITYHIIERAQFPLNKSIYVPGAVPVRESPLPCFGPRPLSFMDWYLRQQEALQSRIRRFESPDEHPFFPDALCTPILLPLHYPPILHANDVVVNDRIRQYYIDELLPAVCPDFGHGDRGETQENYGSSATCDIACLQALSRRIHFGKFVAEAKFRAEPERFTTLIRARDRDAIGDAITSKQVEQAVLQRLRRKVETYGQDLSSSAAAPAKIDVDAVVRLYEDFIIPWTKVVEVDYLLQRLDNPPPPPWYAPLQRFVASAAADGSLAYGAAVGAGAVLGAAGTVALRWLSQRH